MAMNDLSEKRESPYKSLGGTIMKRIFLLTILAVLCFPLTLWAQTDAERGQAFILESKRLPVAERVDRAVLTIQNSTDDAVVAEAVTDLAQFWNNPEGKLAVIEDVLSKADKKSKTFQRAELAKARTLARLGQKAAAFAGKWEESTRLCIEIMEDYYPGTMAGANSALGLALYISSHDKDSDGAERLLYDILERSPYDGIAPFVYVALAEIADARGDRAKALTLLEESFNRVGTAPYGRGPERFLRQNAQQLKSKIMGQ
jgi:hypothetical protein